MRQRTFFQIEAVVVCASAHNLGHLRFQQPAGKSEIPERQQGDVECAFSRASKLNQLRIWRTQRNACNIIISYHFCALSCLPHLFSSLRRIISCIYLGCTLHVYSQCPARNLGSFGEILICQRFACSSYCRCGRCCPYANDWKCCCCSALLRLGERCLLATMPTHVQSPQLLYVVEVVQDPQGKTGLGLLLIGVAMPKLLALL